MIKAPLGSHALELRYDGAGNNTERWHAYYDDGSLLGGIYTSDAMEMVVKPSGKGRMRDDSLVKLRATNLSGETTVDVTVTASFTIGKQGKFKLKDRTNRTVLSGRGEAFVGNCNTELP